MADDEQSFGADVWELADRYAATFIAANEGEANEEEEPGSCECLFIFNCYFLCVWIRHY